MIRLLAVLLVFMFMALWFLGADEGQFITPHTVAAQRTAAPVPERPVFIPAQRVMEETPVAPLSPATVPQPAAVLPPTLPTQLEPALAAIRLMHVPGGASVRAGPALAFEVIGDLAMGDVVMVVDETSAPGWVRIRVDGRGEGWVAAKLLRE